MNQRVGFFIIEMGIIQDWIYRALVLDQLRFYYQLPAILFLSIPLILWIYIAYRRRRAWRIRYSVASLANKIPRVKRRWMPSRHLPLIFRLLVLSLIILAAMRPQMGKTHERITTQGIDIMMVLDISPSMLAEDFQPNRLEAAKEVLADFVGRNQNDRIGLVVFSGMAFTQCPITTDTVILEEFIMQIQIGDILEGGTAIGDAILTGVSRLREKDVPSRVMILLTDGEHNWGEYDPETSARIAAREGIRIYTIGVGSYDPTPIPDPEHPGQYLRNYYGGLLYTEIDEDSLQQIADLTGGRYYRAEDEEALANIYEEIGQLETTDIESYRYVTYSEIFQVFLILALILLALELVARFIWGRVIP